MAHEGGCEGSGVNPKVCGLRLVGRLRSGGRVQLGLIDRFGQSCMI